MRDGIGANEWLVQWKVLLESEATWELVYLMNQQFPYENLEDKVSFDPSVIVRPPILHTYRRRGKKGITPAGTSKQVAEREEFT